MFPALPHKGGVHALPVGSFCSHGRYSSPGMGLQNSHVLAVSIGNLVVDLKVFFFIAPPFAAEAVSGRTSTQLTLAIPVPCRKRSM